MIFWFYPRTPLSSHRTAFQFQLILVWHHFPTAHHVVMHITDGIICNSKCSQGAGQGNQTPEMQEAADICLWSVGFIKHLAGRAETWKRNYSQLSFWHRGTWGSWLPWPTGAVAKHNSCLLSYHRQLAAHRVLSLGQYLGKPCAKSCYCSSQKTHEICAQLKALNLLEVKGEAEWGEGLDSGAGGGGQLAGKGSCGPGL